jgi:virulence factor Mce-like protein
MKATRDLVELPARFVVESVKLLTRHKLLTSCIGIALTLVATGLYVLVGSLGFNPARSTMAIRIMLPESGGLLPNQDVTVRGIPVGRVTSVQPSGNGVMAVVDIKSDVRIPQSSPVRVSGLSPAGEQYLDFRPQTNSGPVLKDGSTVSERHTTIPVSLARLLGDADGALAQVDPTKLAAITNELRVSAKGPQKLADLLDGGTLLLTTLDSVLPQTVSLIRDAKTVFTTLDDGKQGLAATAGNLREILAGVKSMDGGFRTLLDKGGRPLTLTQQILTDNSATMGQLLLNLTEVAKDSYARVPALKAMFPTHRGSTAEAVASIVHDGAIWELGDPYPRYGCDYPLPRHSPVIPDFHEPYLYTYCANPDPSVLIRGARNAPRPPGDDTAGPPPGYDPLKTSDPTPVGRWTIPTTYGGPPLPQFPPR